MAHAISASESKLNAPSTAAPLHTAKAAQPQNAAQTTPPRPIPIAPSDDIDELDNEGTGDAVLEYLPSWLVSLVVHLVLVLLMALFTVAGNGGLGGDGVLLSMTSGGDGGPGNDELWAAALEAPSELVDAQPLETATEIEVDTPLDTPTQIDLVDPIEVSVPSEIVSAAGGTADAGQGGGNDAATGSGSGDGQSAQTAIFGIVDEGMDFVYVFDRSESMNSRIDHKIENRVVFSMTPLAAAKAELVKSLSDLKVQNRFHILFYNHESWLFDAGRGNQRGLITATDDNKTRAVAFVDSVYGDGQTRHVPPLEAAIRMRPDVIFLLTDGEEKDDPTPAELGKLRKLNKGRSRINVIQFVYQTQISSALETLASENGGKHKYIDISQLGPVPGVVMEKQIPNIQPADPDGDADAGLDTSGAADTGTTPDDADAADQKAQKGA